MLFDTKHLSVSVQLSAVLYTENQVRNLTLINIMLATF